jgi:protein tyrosine/serine phosphatase
MFIFFHLVHLRIPALRILGHDVLSIKGLVGLCKDSLVYSKPQILETLTSTLYGPRPVLIHCTQGKDRTGLIFALILLLLEVPEEAINHDYMLSDEGLAPIRPQMIEEVKEIGMDEDYTRAAPKFVHEMRMFLDNEFGGVRNYLDTIGFGKDKQQELEDLLRA